MQVPTYTVPYYMAGQRTAPPYPKDLRIKYPKVGEKNPTVTLHLLEVSSPSAPRKVDFQTYAPDDLIITEVAWVAEKHESLIFRTQNRVQDTEKLVLIDVESGDTKVVRERDGTDGWLDTNHAITCELFVRGRPEPAEKPLTPWPPQMSPGFPLPLIWISRIIPVGHIFTSIQCLVVNQLR